MLNSPPIPYTADQARKDYPLKLRRAAVLEMAARFGYSENSVRKLIEGRKATETEAAVAPVLQRKTFVGQTRGYFDREEVLRAIC